MNENLNTFGKSPIRASSSLRNLNVEPTKRLIVYLIAISLAFDVVTTALFWEPPKYEEGNVIPRTVLHSFGIPIYLLLSFFTFAAYIFSIPWLYERNWVLGVSTAAIVSASHLSGGLSWYLYGRVLG